MPLSQPSIAEKLREALVINRTDSKCGACGRETLPRGETHTDISGYKPVPGGGCGVRWRYVTSDYTGMREAVQDVRPDLEWFARWPGFEEEAA